MSDRAVDGGDPAGRDRPAPTWLPSRRTALVLAAGLVPWVLIPYEAGLSPVFSFGLVTPEPYHLQTVLEYVSATRGLPQWLWAWPTASLLYALALVSWALGFAGREDRRVTTGLLALAGLDVLYFSVAFTDRRIGIVALPVGVAVLWLAAWESRPSGWLRADGR